MNLFKSFTLKWWQVGVLKLSLISLGIILGVYFQAFFLPWIVIVTIIFVLGALYTASVWWQQVSTIAPKGTTSDIQE